MAPHPFQVHPRLSAAVVKHQLFLPISCNQASVLWVFLSKKHVSQVSQNILESSVCSTIYSSVPIHHIYITVCSALKTTGWKISRSKIELSSLTFDQSCWGFSTWEAKLRKMQLNCPVLYIILHGAGEYWVNRDRVCIESIEAILLIVLKQYYWVIIESIEAVLRVLKQYYWEYGGNTIDSIEAILLRVLRQYWEYWGNTIEVQWEQ